MANKKNQDIVALSETDIKNTLIEISMDLQKQIFLFLNNQDLPRTIKLVLMYGLEQTVQPWQMLEKDVL